MVEHIEQTVYHQHDMTSFKHVTHYYWM